MNIIGAIISALLTRDSDAEGLRVTAPEYLDGARAHEHTVAARIAGAIHGVDPDLLLATAYRESHYETAVTYRESSGSLSCGVVQSTAKNVSDCNRLNSSLLAGYEAGAAALRRNVDFCRGDVRCALSWYAGGARFVRNCREQPERFKRQCSIPDRRINRAKRIKDARRKAASS